MKSPSLDAIYAQIDKYILLAQSYTEIEELSFIIKSCRLKPYSYVFEKKDNKLVVHRWWFDEFGNSLKIVKGKRLEITYNDLSVNLDEVVCTDLYYGLSINKIAKMSKLVYLFVGKDEDLYQDCCFLTFLGIDNYLRSYIYLNNKWQQVSPLLLGLKNLKIIKARQDIKYFIEFENKKNMPIPCVSEQSWLSFLPPSQDFLSQVKKQNEEVYNILKMEI